MLTVLVSGAQTLFPVPDQKAREGLWVPRDTSTVPLTLCYAPISFNSLYPICEVCIRESNTPSSYSANFGLEFITEKLE